MCRDLTLILYILSLEIVAINSKTSTLWKLNSDQTKIVGVHNYQFPHEDALLEIIASTEHYGEAWIKRSSDSYCANCQDRNFTSRQISAKTAQVGDESLDCGKPANFTYYDNLVGVLNRNRHPIVPEPQAISHFTKYNKNKNDMDEFDMEALEQRLRKAKREKPKSVQMFNQLGNYWRIKGHAGKAIECFRKALAVAPANAEVLLNLARVLFSLQYLDDAIYLTRRSIEVHPPEKGAWQQYFTLGEIFKAYGHYQEATVHLKRSLEINPGFEPAQIALKEMETMPAATIHIYTLVIIVCLVLGVLLVILSSVDNIEYTVEDLRSQRHFNKAMAMRSLRGVTAAAKRCKRQST